MFFIETDRERERERKAIIDLGLYPLATTNYRHPILDMPAIDTINIIDGFFPKHVNVIIILLTYQGTSRIPRL